jgi:diguanylate cyclase (GGDEF)-like protein
MAAGKKTRISTSIYPMRVIGFFLASSSVYLARDLSNSHADLWAWLPITIFIFYPHIALVQFITRKQRGSELLNLLADMVLIGVVANLVYFNPAIALPYLIANSATNYNVRGIWFVLKGLLAFIAGVAVSSLFFGLEFRSDTRLVEYLPAFAYLILATHYIGYLSYTRGVALIRAKQEAEDLAHMDGLTDIPNRRSFDARFEAEWQRAHRDNSWLSLIWLDIDFFKAYNDLYGHPAGDDCLKQVAREISNLVGRPGDLVARTGGEEFAVLLPGSDQEGALEVAERILNGVQALQIRHEGSRIDRVVTVSIGVAALIPVASFSPRGQMLAADQALYRAKEEGRNRICVHQVSTTRVTDEPGPGEGASG